MANRLYTLTDTAVEDLRAAKQWSRSRWSADLTRKYFEDLHKGAEYIAKHYKSLRKRDELAGDTGLSLYPVREHYIVYIPVTEKHIIVVAFIRQVGDVPAILAEESWRIRREVDEIRDMIARGEINI